MATGIAPEESLAVGNLNLDDSLETAYLVYEYGCLPPVRGREQAIEQMFRRRRLWNALVEVERKHRAEVTGLLHDDSSDEKVKGLMAHLESLRLLISARRQSARKRSVEVTDLKDEIAATKADLSSLIARAKQDRRLRAVEQKENLAALELVRRLAVKQARAESGLYWCNYDDVISAYETARRRTLKDGRELRFQRWDGSGKVTVRFQTGLAVGEAFQADRRLQIKPVDPLAWSSPKRSVRRKLARSSVMLRVGSDGREPVWLELPVVLHRPLPGNGTVRSASVVLEKVGRQERWRLLVTVELPSSAPREGLAVAVDFGWRCLPEGLRVAYWVDERGDHGQLLLPPDMLWQFSKINDLRSIQDQHLQSVLLALSAWSAQNRLPDWMDLKAVSQWKNPGRLLRLHADWKNQRVEGDEWMFGRLCVWKERHEHLHEWEVNLRDQVLRYRKDIYRQFVAGLLRNHGQVFVEDFDIGALAGKQPPEKEQKSFTGGMRVVAAVSLLRRTLEEKGSCVRIPAQHTTQLCSWCGYSGRWDATDGLLHSCAGCGKIFDQDQNAARNILRRGLDRAQPSSGEAVAETAES